MDENTAPAPATRKRRLAALAGLLLVGTLAACGPKDGSSAASAALTTPPASASASTSSAPPTSPPSSSAPVQPAPTMPTNPGIASGEPAPVKLPALGYQSTGTTLTVTFYGGTCQQYGLKADESQQGKVVVRVVVTKAAGPGHVCSNLVKENTVSAQLSKPLQGRTVIDLATGQEVPQGSGPIGGPQTVPAAQ